MPALQPRLFPDPQPLVERLGGDFFRRLPAAPGVYLMRDARDAVLYVGKARSLRRRLGCYRVANPERMAPRTLRLLRLVERIELELCADEGAALRRESELLLALKPRFNRAGVWQGPKRFLVWRVIAGGLEITITEKPPPGWHAYGPLGGHARRLRRVAARLLWLRTHPGRDVADLPAGWARGGLPETVRLPAEPGDGAAGWLENLLQGRHDCWRAWLDGAPTLRPFTRKWIGEDLDRLAKQAGGALLPAPPYQPAEPMAGERAAFTAAPGRHPA